LVFIKKKGTKLVFFSTEPEPVQTDWFRFGSVILEQKPVQTGLDQFFRFGSVFFLFEFGSVFQFQAYQTETEPVGFLKILIGLISFFTVRSFSYFFSDFLNLIDFLIFLLISVKYCC
jgi:hypothetical protein